MLKRNGQLCNLREVVQSPNAELECRTQMQNPNALV